MTLALTARDRAAEVRRVDPGAVAHDAIVSLIMAAAATEAFINELGEYFELRRKNSETDPSEVACGMALAEVERTRGSTELKYQTASLALSGRIFDRSIQPFQDFSTLMTARNHLMHPKPLDRFDESGRMVPPRYVQDFQQRGMAWSRDLDASVSWLNLLETEHIASWACQAAVEIIVAITEIAPTATHSAVTQLRKHYSGYYRSWARHLTPPY